MDDVTVLSARRMLAVLRTYRRLREQPAGTAAGAHAATTELHQLTDFESETLGRLVL
jgi:hypothetical protein